MKKNTNTTLLKFTRSLFERVLENLDEGCNTHSAIEKEGISVRHFYRELKKQPEWAHAFKHAQIERDQIRNTLRIESAEAELHRRAVEGWDQQVFDQDGHLKGSRRRYSDQCLLFLLRSLKRDRYGDQATVVQNEINLTPQMTAQETLRQWRSQLGGSTETNSAE